MSRVTLIQAAPRRADTGATVTLRLAGGGSRAYTHLGFADWLDGVMGEPLFTSLLGFDQSGWTSSAIPQTAAIGVAAPSAERAAALAGLVWAQAPIAVSVGDDVVANPAWSTRLAGRVAGATSRNGVLSLTVADLTAALNQPVCPGTYAGTGGLEGGTALTGQVKRRSWGRVFNVEGNVADTANQIWEFGDPAHPLQSFLTIKDRGRAYDQVVVGWAGSAEATLAALVAATPPQGGAAVAPSIARAKPWTQPSGPITADLLGEIGAGYAESAPAIAAAIAAAVGGVPTQDLAIAAALRPDPAGWHVGNGSDTAAAVLLKLLLGVSMVWTISPTGALLMLPIGYDDPVELVDFDSVERTETYPPVRAVKLGFAPNNRVHTDAEISAAIVAGDVSGLGPLALAPFAQLGSTVVDSHGSVIGDATVITSLGTAAGLYGQSPWATYGGLSPFDVAGQVQGLGTNGFLSSSWVYKPNTGYLIDFWPATTGADKTSGATAAGFYGQGALATLSGLTLGGPFLAGFGALAALPSIAFGSPYLLEAAGGASAALAAFKTALGIASGFTGQTAWATLGTTTNVISRLQSDGYIEAGTIYRSGVGFLDAFFPAEGGANVTASHTAAGIVGQGPWATTAVSVSSVTRPGTNLMPTPRPLAGSSPQQAGWSDLAAFSGSTSGAYMGVNDYAPFGGLSWFIARNSGGAAANLFTYYEIPIPADGSTYTLSMFQRAANAGPTTTYFEFWTAGHGALVKSGIYLAPIGDADAVGVQRYAATSGNAQDGNGNWGSIIRLVVVCPFPAASTYQDTYWYGVKAEAGSQATTYSDDRKTISSRSFLWDGGLPGESLRPGEYGSNRTEGRTAAAFAGQTAFATAPQIGGWNVGNYFSFSAFQLGYSITRADGSTTVTESMVITGYGIAAGFNGQAPAATDPTIQPGADVTAQSQHALTQLPAVNIQASYQGAVAAGQLPYTVSLRHTVGQNDVSPGSNYTVSLSPANGADVTLNNSAGDLGRGNLTINSLSASQVTAIVASTYGGVTLYSTVQINRIDAAPPQTGGGGGGGGGGASASTSTFSAPGTSYAELGRIPAVTLGSSKQVQLSASLTYTVTSEGSASPGDESQSGLVTRWQFSTDGGGGWSDAQGDVGYDAPASRYFSIEPPKGDRNSPGSTHNNITVTIGAAAVGGAVVFRLIGYSDGRALHSVTGTAVAAPQ